LAASKNLSQPSLAFFPLSSDYKPALPGSPFFRSQELRVNLSHFQQLADIFSALEGYLAVLERHHASFKDETYLCKLADQRNFIQHCLLSLPPRMGNNEPLTGVHLFYEAFRLSALIFSFGVVFPMSYDAAPFSTLAILLKTEIQYLDMNSQQSLPCTRNMLAWVLIIGAIGAAAKGSVRAWFVARLKNLALGNGISAWSEIKSILEKVLWLNSACDSAGQQVWAEVGRLRSV
jgi:hypothetical protein